MRAFRKGLPYYYPLPEHTIRSLFTRIFSPFAHGQSSTFIVKRGFGGARALIKFMLREVNELSISCAVPVSLHTYTYAYIDADLIEQKTSSAYERLLWELLAESLGISPVKFSLKYYGSRIWEHLENKELVIVLSGISYLDYVDMSVWSRIAALQVYPEKVHFLFVLNEGGPVGQMDERFKPLRQVLCQNTVTFDHLSRQDIEYSIDRWAYTLECDFNEHEREEIRTVSLGSPRLLKICCFARADMKRNRKQGYLHDHPAVKGMTRIDVPVSLKENELFSRITEKLTSVEYDVFMKLLVADSAVVSRDDIASAVWGGDISKYSDGALTQMIRRIKGKIAVSTRESAKENVKDNSFAIKASYGKGYRLVRKK